MTIANIGFYHSLASLAMFITRMIFYLSDKNIFIIKEYLGMIVRNIVDKFKNRVCSVLGQNLVTLYWFGSTATGKASLDSDIDLLIETTKPLTPQKRDQIADIAIDLCADWRLT